MIKILAKLFNLSLLFLQLIDFSYDFRPFTWNNPTQISTSFVLVSNCIARNDVLNQFFNFRNALFELLLFFPILKLSFALNPSFFLIDLTTDFSNLLL
jgi:hypothetical protein